jgi:hypothetical protein
MWGATPPATPMQASRPRLGRSWAAGRAAPRPPGLRPLCAFAHGHPLRSIKHMGLSTLSEAIVDSARRQGIACEIPSPCIHFLKAPQGREAGRGLGGRAPPGSGAVGNPAGRWARWATRSVVHGVHGLARVVHGATGHWAERLLNSVPPERERWQRRTTYRVRSSGPLGRMKP